MGKKLARNAEKMRIETLQTARRERLAKAGMLLERWGQADRLPLESTPELAESDPLFIEDKMTLEVIHSLNASALEIAILHWAKGLSAVEIAEHHAIPRSDVRQTLGLVVEQVANKVLM